MEPVSTIVAFLASFAPALTAPTMENLGVLLRGALLATGPRTVTACLVAACPWVTKHWSAYDNVFRRARLGMLALARILFGLVLRLVPSEAEILLAIDESLVRRYGPELKRLDATMADESLQNIKAQERLDAMIARLRQRYDIASRPELVMRIRFKD